VLKVSLLYVLDSRSCLALKEILQLIRGCKLKVGCILLRLQVMVRPSGDCKRLHGCQKATQILSEPAEGFHKMKRNVLP
jgi:hypothetical protein